MARRLSLPAMWRKICEQLILAFQVSSLWTKVLNIPRRPRTRPRMVLSPAIQLSSLLQTR
jgi:hypothetical protein